MGWPTQPSLRHRHKSGRNKGFGCGPKTRDVDSPHRNTNMLVLVIEIVATSFIINPPVFSSEHLLNLLTASVEGEDCWSK